jgi:autotransporter-associated beta strand protein
MRLLLVGGLTVLFACTACGQSWNGYVENAQHTALSQVGSQPLQSVHWSTQVDLDPQIDGGDIFAHYGSPVITPGNTVIVPVKTGATSGFELNAYNGKSGNLLWTQSTDYALPPQSGGSYSWTPPYSPTISNGTLYYAGDGGTIYERASLDSSGSVTPTQVAFFGSLNTYQSNAAAYNANVAISTPITADSQGDIYFGYTTTSSAPGGLTSGIARISSTGVGTFFRANLLQASASPAGMTQVATNSAPALSPDGQTVYVTMSTGNYSSGRLVALNASTLAPESSVELMDPKTNSPAPIPNDGTASPMVGPDGDVYMGVLDNYGTSRGWLEHFSANLSVQKPTGGFGWDDTASIVPASMVPTYHGTSSYLIMTKYNNYADPGTGGNGQNMVAILDPNATQTDTRFNSNGAGGAAIMQTVLTALGPTPDPNFDQQFPGAVHEWCINTAAVDPATDSVMVNSEDGNMYRWNLIANSFTQVVNITSGIGEAYTPTEIGPDGTVYAINDAKLWAIGATSTSTVYSTWTATDGGTWQTAGNWSAGAPGLGGDVATFDSSITSPSSVSVGSGVKVGTLTFYSSNSYTITPGTGTLAMDNGTSTSPAQIIDCVGNHTISAPMLLATDTTIAVGQPSNTLTISGNIIGSHGLFLGNTAAALSQGTVVLSGSNSYAGGTTVTAGTLDIAANGALADGSVSISGGLLELAPNTGQAQVTSLAITGSGVLDIANNHLIITYTGSSPIATIAGYIESGYNGGGWDGTSGIISTAAKGNSAYGIGYADSADPGNPAGLPAGEIEVKYTLFGDTNLDGTVNGVDFGILAANFNKSVSGWDAGDFNYDNIVNGVDFGTLAQNFNQGASGADWSLLESFAAANGLLADVPEPGEVAGVLALLAIYGFCSFGRSSGRGILPPCRNPITQTSR